LAGPLSGAEARGNAITPSGVGPRAHNPPQKVIAFAHSGLLANGRTPLDAKMRRNEHDPAPNPALNFGVTRFAAGPAPNQ
jgi:hypothetical protein